MTAPWYGMPRICQAGCFSQVDSELRGCPGSTLRRDGEAGMHHTRSRSRIRCEGTYPGAALRGTQQKLCATRVPAPLVHCSGCQPVLLEFGSSADVTEAVGALWRAGPSGYSLAHNQKNSLGSSWRSSSKRLRAATRQNGFLREPTGEVRWCCRAAWKAEERGEVRSGLVV